ncbi:SCO6745 family protein [Actinomycetospora flava]|uniref:SalK n=1 Tax=Actinomycetospora flava TaxID=3129232 RepID=A0ABU8M053_9PSEU
MDDARRLWTLLEPLHAVTYFTREAREAADAAGLRGFWMGYVAQRAAPLGAVGPDAVWACFHGFHRDRITRALPDAWGFADPARCLAARLEGADRSLRRLLADVPGGPEGPSVAEAAELAWTAAGAADTAGRVLGAANQGLPRPAEPHLALWQAATTLREHRGDGHVAVLVAHDVGPVSAHRLKTAARESGSLQESRRLDDAVWATAGEGLLARGWLDGEGALTATGHEAHAAIERDTDRAAAGPWRALGGTGTDRLAELLRPLAAAAADAIPFPNPIGLPRA